MLPRELWQGFSYTAEDETSLSSPDDPREEAASLGLSSAEEAATAKAQPSAACSAKDLPTFAGNTDKCYGLIVCIP